VRKIGLYHVRQTLLLLVIFLAAPFVVAQEGHPLDGTWSGDRIVNGEKVRVLVIMRLLPNQRIEGTVIERGVRLPLQDVTLDPADWSMSLTVDGAARDGEAIHYRMWGQIENLGSASNRSIVGRWENDNFSGDFSLTMN
jgi:hypothetical protein